MTKKLTFLLVAMLSLCSISSFERIKNAVKSFCLALLNFKTLKSGSLWAKASLSLLFLVLFVSANATHFRYGNISWTRDVTNPKKVTFKVSQAWRTSYFYSGTTPSVGAQMSSQTVLDFGDGNTSNITLTLSSVNTTDDWMYGDYTVTHTYTNYTSDYTASFSNCCRISTLQNNHDLNFTVSSIVKGAATPIMYSPVSTENPIVNMPVGQTYATTTLPATDPNGYALTYTLTPNGKFGASTVQPASSSNFFINSTTGVISFNTAGLTVGNLYNTSITVTNSVGASTMVDFLIKLVDNTPPPVFTYGSGNTPNNSAIFKIRPGTPITFPVIATNANTGGGTPTTVSLTAVGLPAGSSLATQAGTNPASRTFSWTPTSSDLGTYVLTFVATNNAGAQTYTSVTINVSVSPDFDPATPGNNSTYCAPPGVSSTPVKIKASNLDPSNLVSLSIASSLKSGMSFNPSIPTSYSNPDSTIFTYTPIASDWGIQDILFRATDQQNNTTNLNYYYIVDREPVFTTNPVLTATVGQTYTYNAIATDADTVYGDYISLEAANVPSFLTATDLGHGKVNINGIPTTPGTYNITIDLKDSLSHFNGTHCGDNTQDFQLVVSDCSPNTPSVTSALRCGSGNITLNASSDAGTVVDWYDVATGGSVLATGTSYTPSVSATTTYYAVTRNSTYGCTSARVAVTATVKNATTSTTNASICTGDNYTFNGTTYNAAGTYVYHTTNAAGCDSAASLILTVKSISYSTTHTTVGSTALPYSWNSHSYNVAGTYLVHLTNAAGCDSAATLVLAIAPATSSTTNVTVGSSALPYHWNGNNYNTAGSYTVHLTNAAGSDSAATLILVIAPATSSTTNITIGSSSLPYHWNGNDYNTAGTYTVHLTNAAGSDSAATLILTVAAATSSTTNVTVGSTALPYHWNGNTYNTAGTYTVHLTNVAGSDSAAILVLTVAAATSSTTNSSICSNNLPYTWNGNHYNTAGNHIVHLTNAAGSDSTATLVLTVGTATTSTTNATICTGSSYTFNGITYNIPGTYTAHLINAAGCDSAATVVITNATTYSTTIDSFYAGTTYTFNGTDYTTAGTYSAHLTNAAGCDSTATLVLTIAADTSSVSSGNGGGLESKPLGNAVSQRFINNISNSISERVNYSFIPTVIKTSSIQVMGINGHVSLQSLLPSATAVSSVMGGNINVYPTSPNDLVNMTNALDVQAQDYTRNASCKAVAFATKTSGMIYSHTKPVCDRLKEAELQDISAVNINNINFVQYKLQQKDGSTEYAISFSAGKNVSSSFYEIQSKWLTENYSGLDTMFNFQIWGVNPQVVKSMVKDILNNLNSSAPYYQLTYAPIPQTYIMSHRRNQSAMNVTIKNNTSATTANLQVTEYLNELSAATPSKTIPVTINPNGITTVSFDMADHYQADIKMLDANNNTINDEVYSNDGPWDISYNNATTSIQQFTIANDGIMPANDEYRLFRNVTLKATTSDYVSVYKLLKAAGMPRDISTYNNLQFTANATGAGSLKITFVKNSIIDWNNQYSVTIPAKQGTQEYSINYADLLSNGLNGIDAGDVTAITISFIVNNSNTALNASISNARLVKSTTVITPTVDTKMTVYPNPVVNGTFSCSFKSTRAEALILKVIETGTGRVLHTQTINTVVGNNTALISLNKASFFSANNYIVTLQGDYSKYDLQKIVIKNN